MEGFNRVCEELIVLSNALYKQEFRKCFIEHLLTRIEVLIKFSSDEHVRVMQGLQLKLLEPVMFHLRNSVSSSDKCKIIEYLLKILSLVPLKETGVFFHLYFLIFCQIFHDEKSVRKTDEELKMMVFDAGRTLLANSDRKMLTQVLRPEHGEKLSIGIFVAVQTAKTEKCIQLRVKALDFLLHASLYEERVQYGEGIYKNLADVFMLYLPGMVGPLQEIILRDETQHHLITLKALTCWGHVICLVFSEAATTEYSSEQELVKQWIQACSEHTEQERRENAVELSKMLLGKKRTKSWLKAASVTLKPLIQKMVEVKKHSNPKCRLELTNVMVKFHEHCIISLEPSMSAVLEVLVSSAVDEDDKIRKIAREYMDGVFRKEKDGQQRHLVFMIEKNVCFLINKLPGIIHSGDEKLILSSLRSLTGYLKILAETGKLVETMIFLPNLKKLLKVIEMAFQMQNYSGISKQDYLLQNSAADVEKEGQWEINWKRFEHFRDDSIREELEKICCNLGKNRCAEMCLDYLQEVFKGEYFRRKEILLISNQIVLGAQEMSDNLASEMLDFYLDPDNLEVPLEVGRGNCENLKDAHSNIIQVALIMEGICHLARNLRRKIERFTLRTLYAIMKCMGSSYCLINFQAHKAAAALSTACGLKGDINSLIKKNLDYLTHHTRNKLKRNDPGVFDVLAVLINSSSMDSVSEIEEIVTHVLNTSARDWNSPSTISCLRMLEAFVLRVRKWTSETDHRNDSNTSSHPNKWLYKTQAQELVESTMKKEETDAGDEEEGELPTKEETEGAKEPVPKHVSLTVAVSNHCLHFLASKDKYNKLIVVRVLNESVLVLRPWENEVLPLIHKIWSPLVTRLEDTSDAVLLRASFGLLCTLAQTSKQFIRSRTLKSVLPSLQLILSREASKSKMMDSSSGYYFTQNFKLQRELLENLADLATDLELFEKQMDAVVESAMPYLSATQPKQLQEKCRHLFLRLTICDPYLVWLKLHRLTSHPEYSTNVQIILNIGQ